MYNTTFAFFSNYIFNILFQRHAGFYYSGPTSAWAYQYLEPKEK